MLSYLLEYGVILVLATLFVGLLHVRRRFDLVQVNTPPDTLVFAALVPKLLGARVLLALKEPMPEFFAAKFKVPNSNWKVRLVSFAEQLSIRFADSAFTCTSHMRDAFVGRGAGKDKFSVVLPSSSEEDFAPPDGADRRRASDDGSFVLISHGSIEERYGLDTIVRAIDLLRDEMPMLRLQVFGEGSYRTHLQQLCAALNLGDRVTFSSGWVPLEELRLAIANASAGVVAMKRDAFRDLTHCNKMYDFISMRRPAIVSRTRSVDDYFDDSSLLKFVADDPADLARAIRELAADPFLGERLVARAAEVNEPYRWPHQRDIYLGVVEGMLSSRNQPQLQRPARRTL